MGYEGGGVGGLFDVFVSLVVVTLPIFSTFTVADKFSARRLSGRRDRGVVSGVTFGHLSATPRGVPVGYFSIGRDKRVTVNDRGSTSGVITVCSSANSFLCTLDFRTSNDFNIR